MAKPKITEEARRAAEAKAAKEVRGGAKAKAVEAGTHPAKRPKEMAVPPGDLRLIKGIVAKPTRAASQKRTAAQSSRARRRRSQGDQAQRAIAGTILTEKAFFATLNAARRQDQMLICACGLQGESRRR